MSAVEKYGQEKKKIISRLSLVIIIIWITMMVWETWKWRWYIVV